MRSGTPPALADGFTARPESAPGLAPALAPGSAVALVPGGPGAGRSRVRLESSGKTQLAVHLAESLWQTRQVDLLVWVDATSRASVLSGYVEAAAALGADPADAAESVAARLVRWLGEAGRPWIVVLDDLRAAPDLDGLWPEGPAGRTLITAPDEGIVPAGGRALVFQIGAFTPREALDCLRGHLTADRDQRHGAIDLVGDLGREPAALGQAGATIASSRLSCSEYREELARRRAQHAARAEGQPPAAAVTWAIAADQAGRLSPGGAVRSLLALAALLGGHRVPGTVFTTPAVCGYLAESGSQAAADPEQAWDAVLSLELAGLLTIDAGAQPAVRMSPVVQERVRQAMPGRMLDRAARAAADALLQAWPDEEPRPWLASGLRSCAASLRRAAGERLWAAGGCHPLLLRAGRSMDGARLTGPAVSFWAGVAADCERFLGHASSDTLAARGHLARACLAAGQAADAVTWSRSVLAGHARMLGADHPGTIAARVSLGRAMVAAGQHGDAVAVLEVAVREYERVLGAGHLDAIGAADELAAAYRAAGRAEEAVLLCRRALADRERVQGPRHPDTLSARDRLAGACLAGGRLKEALAHYARALADRERALGSDHPDTITSRGTMAAAQLSAGKMAAALQLYEQVCADCERVLGAGHPGTLARRAELAHAYDAAGRLTDAAALLRDTLARCERALPPGDPLTRSLRGTAANIARG